MDNTNIKKQLSRLRKKLEGPVALRYISATAGAALTICSIYQLISMGMGILTHWNLSYLITLAGLAGFTVFCVEIKDVAKFGSVMEWYHRWFPFLTVMWGKGLMMIFAGALGFAFVKNLIMLIPAMCLCGAGFIYFMMYFGKFKQYQEEFEKSQMIQSTYHCSFYPEATALVQTGEELLRSKYHNKLNDADSF